MAIKGELLVVCSAKLVDDAGRCLLARIWLRMSSMCSLLLFYWSSLARPVYPPKFPYVHSEFMRFYWKRRGEFWITRETRGSGTAPRLLSNVFVRII